MLEEGCPWSGSIRRLVFERGVDGAAIKPRRVVVRIVIRNFFLREKKKMTHLDLIYGWGWKTCVFEFLQVSYAAAGNL